MVERRSGRAGLRERFENEAIPYLQEIYAFATRLTRSDVRAEDLTQETFLRAFRFFDRYRPGTNIRAWLYRICRNIFINDYHKQVRRPPMTDLDLVERTGGDVAQAPAGTAGDNPEEAVWRTLLSEEVLRAFDRLPDEYRCAVYLVLVQGFSYREAAEILDRPIGTIMSRLHRGRRALQFELLEYAYDARIPTGHEDVLLRRREEAFRTAGAAAEA